MSQEFQLFDSVPNENGWEFIQAVEDEEHVSYQEQEVIPATQPGYTATQMYLEKKCLKKRVRLLFKRSRDEAIKAIQKEMDDLMSQVGALETNKRELEKKVSNFDEVQAKLNLVESALQKANEETKQVKANRSNAEIELSKAMNRLTHVRDYIGAKIFDAAMKEYKGT